MKTVSRHQQTSGGDWKSPLGLALIGYYLVMAVVGLLIPDDILSANAWARKFSDFMASIVPQIDRITALGIKPDVNRFYFAVLWMSSPVAFFFSALLVLSGRQKNYPMWSMPFFKSLLFISIPAVFFSWAQFLWGVNPEMRLTKFLFAVDLARGFYTQLVFCTGVVFGIAGVTVWLAGWITGYIPRCIQEQKNG
ncbi:hypothetical protein [Hydrogenophaga laconesensis]|uniref:Uncharacterized protein n=1 Tax=Hydrogenophaga laconesensis TaxID=1805971 RepID=A0ABU1VIA3_9BURK|nr:hypothetical protein [Hydrogenophaga laconesensis]MDR7097216.1 hypothetical protein [Hydrogenophaga laconesensis]